MNLPRGNKIFFPKNLQCMSYFYLVFKKGRRNSHVQLRQQAFAFISFEDD